MKRFHIGFLINTWYGAFCVSVVSGLVFLLMYWWLGVYEELAILLMCIMGLHILFLLLVLMVAITNLARHHLFVGLLQVTLFFILSVAFVTCLGIEKSEKHPLDFQRSIMIYFSHPRRYTPK